MKNKLHSLLIFIVVASGLISATFITAISYPDGAPSSVTGSPGDNNKTCTKSGCHSGTAGTMLNAMTSNIPAAGYVPGTTYQVTATISDPSLVKFGFEISPQNAAGTVLGTMSLTDATKTKFTASNGKYITHTTSGNTWNGHTATWSFNWKAPVAGTGAVTFYGSFMYANNNGGTSGDIVKTSTYTVQEAVSACNLTVTPVAATICKGSKQTITASGATSYTWAPSTGLDVTTGAVVVAKPTSTTTYTVTGDGGACSKTVTITVNPAPTATISAGACTAGSILLTRGGTPTTGVTYKWQKDGVNISGATNSTYLATLSGSYTVKVTITATGCNKTSKATAVTISCKMGEEPAINAAAYPNPFSNAVNIQIGSLSKEKAIIRLLDISGRAIHIYNDVDPAMPFEINEDLTPGIYFVRIEQGDVQQVIKIVKTE
ncbi:MAG: T9SS type A sorting domain-containing protein [Chitinophagales bacterium]|nr:T9SS type A sorting domain-containing protein [Chitinophagales bacterium]